MKRIILPVTIFGLSSIVTIPTICQTQISKKDNNFLTSKQSNNQSIKNENQENEESSVSFQFNINSILANFKNLNRFGIVLVSLGTLNLVLLVSTILVIKKQGFKKNKTIILENVKEIKK